MRSRFSPLDLLLLVMVLIWAANYSVVKAALVEIPPTGFNALRLVIAAALFLGTIAALHASGRIDASLSRRDLAIVVALGIVGQFVYQMLFMTGLARTSVANSALIIGCTPVFVTFLVAALGHERVRPAGWAGAALSALGIYVIVGRGASIGGATIAGDLAMLGAVFCWAAASVGARGVLTRHSAIVVTGYALAIGSVLYLPFGVADLRALEWSRVSVFAWASLTLSAVLSLYVSYVIWYTAVQRLGSARTSVYSNLVPVAAMVIAYVGIHEPIGATKLIGAAAILGGVALARLGGVKPSGKVVARPIVADESAALAAAESVLPPAEL